MPGKALFDGSLQKLGECICTAYDSDMFSAPGVLRAGFCGPVGVQAITVKNLIMKSKDGAVPQLVVNAVSILQGKRVSEEQIVAGMLVHLKSSCPGMQGRKESLGARKVITDEASKIKRILQSGNTILYGRNLSDKFVANGKYLHVRANIYIPIYSHT